MTGVIALQIETASAKIASGMPEDEDEDYDIPIWAGVLPLRNRASTRCSRMIALSSMRCSEPADARRARCRIKLLVESRCFPPPAATGPVLVSSPPPKPVRSPLLPITRWQGTRSESDYGHSRPQPRARLSVCQSASRYRRRTSFHRTESSAVPPEPDLEFGAIETSTAGRTACVRQRNIRSVVAARPRKAARCRSSPAPGRAASSLWGIRSGRAHRWSPASSRSPMGVWQVTVVHHSTSGVRKRTP